MCRSKKFPVLLCLRGDRTREVTNCDFTKRVTIRPPLNTLYIGYRNNTQILNVPDWMFRIFFLCTNVKPVRHDLLEKHVLIGVHVNPRMT